MVKHAESIIFLVDLDPEVEKEASKGLTRLELLKQCISFFAVSKRRTCINHMYGLLKIEGTVVVPPTSSSTSSGCLTSSTEDLMKACSALKPCCPQSQSSAPLDMAAVLSAVHAMKAGPSWAPPVRVILFYCRSSMSPTLSVPINKLMGCPVDVLYIHDKPQAGVNCPQQVYSELEEIADKTSKLVGHNSYIFEVTASNSRKLLNVMVQLLAHPLQRPPQHQLSPNPPDLATLELLPVGGCSSSTVPAPATAAAAASTVQQNPGIHATSTAGTSSAAAAAAASVQVTCIPSPWAPTGAPTAANNISAGSWTPPPTHNMAPRTPLASYHQSLSTTTIMSGASGSTTSGSTTPSHHLAVHAGIPVGSVVLSAVPPVIYTTSATTATTSTASSNQGTTQNVALPPQVMAALSSNLNMPSGGEASSAGYRLTGSSGGSGSGGGALTPQNDHMHLSAAAPFISTTPIPGLTPSAVIVVSQQGESNYLVQPEGYKDPKFR
ncbi:hypothetical protein CEUSTIGMA_g11090.t1 [Chlamydomonas eustigma]|uniref:Uncharacterized protein n=1 Tax=Chlamydomonas eustigma TaxID=1157962 RepID=A0A250XKP5_9CHLO|nr:hypothetical protein CEUSTIGMA_g11090.t1 [Chlamydomonas eustigma]|eukprot:GAX83665.1 hypothetical protein CEUSTIGMA_g11090.t1 [Chlamydomonas eustigma]